MTKLKYLSSNEKYWKFVTDFENVYHEKTVFYPQTINDLNNMGGNALEEFMAIILFGRGGFTSFSDSLEQAKDQGMRHGLDAYSNILTRGGQFNNCWITGSSYARLDLTEGLKNLIPLKFA